ncbi:MAG: MFS transporter [Proteobacteria bacterium]|nr:MFS transporter [Pseudomonadota bacterium]
MVPGTGADTIVSTQEKPLKGAWGITALLFFFMLINFADKIVVGLIGMEGLGFTPEQFGLLGSSFFFLFAISAIVVGFIANRVQAKNALLVMAIVWSLVQFPMLGTASFGVILACRIVLGAGEGPASPVAIHAMYKWFPDSRRGLPTAILSQGSAVGVIVAVPILTEIIARFSWHWAFGALGIAGLVWAVAWRLLGREGTLVDPPVSAVEGAEAGPERVPYRYLLTCPSIVAVCCAGFASYWGLALGLTWFPSYLISGLGLDEKLGRNLTVLPWLFGSFVLLTGGFVSQQLKSKGVSSRWCRGALASITMIAGGCLMPLVGSMPSPALKIAVLVFGSAIGATIYVVIPMIVSELTPQAQRAGMLAIVNSVVTLAGVLAPLTMGAMVQHAETPVAGFEQGYVVFGVLLLAGGLIGLLFIRPEADRKRLAARAVALPLQPARA